MPHSLYQHGEGTPRAILELPSRQNYDFLFGLALESAEAWQWRGRVQTLSGLEDALWSDTYEHAVVVERASGTRIGYVAINNLNSYHGTAYLNLYATARSRRSGVHFEAAVLLIDRGFKYCGLRKFYAESVAAVHSLYGRHPLLKSEAVLRDHVRRRGLLADVVLSSINRAEWLTTTSEISWLQVERGQ